MQLHGTQNHPNGQPDYGGFRCQECGNDIQLGRFAKPNFCHWCGFDGRNCHPDVGRAAAIIRWRGRKPFVNGNLMAYWHDVKQAKELHLAGQSERRIALIQGCSKTAVHNRLLQPFRLLHAELKRLPAWLEIRKDAVNSIYIGIDHQPTPTAPRHVWRTIPTRYGPLTYPHDVIRYPLRL